jgi:hypothetical protein
MADDIFPSNDAEFDDWQKNFVTVVAANPAKYGLLPADVAKLQTLQGAWATKLQGHSDAEVAFHTATKAKDTAGGDLKDAVRGAVRKIHGTAGLAHEDYVVAGIKPHDTVRSALKAPATRPMVRVEAHGHLAVMIHWTDETTPHKNKKPDGMHGVEIWSHVGDPAPADASGYSFIALDTRTPYLDEHPVADAGKSVYYLLRWQNTKGESGPWSEVATIKIPA